MTVSDFLSKDDAKDGGFADVPERIPLGEYLLKRLISIGTKSVFGVPGDYNLSLLEYFYDDNLKTDIKWIGCCNELNASYAADGYSRYTGRISCLLTTLGVGELGALSGVAGACCEDVRVLHVVGIGKNELSDEAQIRDRNMHHMLPDMYEGNMKGPNHRIYYEMIKGRISCSSEYLDDITVACDRIDKVIRDILRHSKPGYLFIPSSFFDQMVESRNLVTSPTLCLKNERFMTSENDIERITDLVLSSLYGSSTPALLGDVKTDRFGINKQLNEFAEMTGIWCFSTVSGKSILDESSKYYMGVYNGNCSLQSVKEKFLSCDLIINFGIDINEANYGFFSYDYKNDAKVIQLHPRYVRFFDNKTKQEEIFQNVNFIDILDRLIHTIDLKQLGLSYDPSFKSFSNDDLVIPEHEYTLSHITQPYLQKYLPNYFNPGDIIISDTGSFQFALRDFKLPSQSKLITQNLYLAIGTALPMALGVGIGMQDYPRNHIFDDSKVDKDYKPKLILFEGDGSAIMTVQELSTMIRYKVPMEIFLLNNNGYTIERAIKGPTRSYNDIMPWKWTLLLEAFGDFDGGFTKSEVLKTRKQMEAKLEKLKLKSQTGIEFHEVILGTFDISTQLSQMIASTSQ
ncbi:hypothetical protein HG535_0C04390 [Zygotorulaspora mrakii]|uniref:Pyruvate decarboxylase n=1 Tax=Zygotorulaspora mrakii TaxID=42260 RepID=A0A7H9B061_ZYGMR|nr:uncharacterized protein HG535_0C04390 [Zygotorulaspora mrakii]QLG72085.1 hypothetical protein HG535_0C04390 [Zygotorulaspora mrakii]